MLDAKSPFLLFTLLLASGCGSDPTVAARAVPTRTDAGMHTACVDEDEDGFGDGCWARDCDDDDPEVTDACYRCGREPDEGCPCDPGTPPDITCTPPPIATTQDGVVGSFVCNEGTRYCRDGYWSACEAVGDYVFVPN